MRASPLRSVFRWTPLLAWLALAAPAAAVDPEQELRPKLGGPEVIEKLRSGGYVVLMRHGATLRDQASADADEEFRIDDCSTQRNLSDEGRQQLAAVAHVVGTRGIPIGDVYTSPYCRCVETGEIAFGKATVHDLLRPEGDMGGSERGARIRRLLGTAPEDGANTFLISHTAALLYSFNLTAKPEGIAHVFRPQEFGPAVYLGAIEPADWVALAGVATSPQEPPAAP